jgi:hypothetical protein
MLLWGIDRMGFRLVPREQGITELRQTKFVVLLFRPFNHGSGFLGDKDILVRRLVWRTSWTRETFDLIFCVETLVGNGIPPFVGTFVDETFGV